MLTNQDIPTPDDLIIQTLLARYAKTKPGQEDLHLVAMLAIDADTVTKKNGRYQFTVQAIVAEINDNLMLGDMPHAHYKIECQYSVTLIPCPDSH